jgi:glycosyltransferase involved in cell wall biosynthesis
LRVLVSAYACEPGRGSEPGVGWSWAREIARLHEVWVITRTNNRKPIEKALAKEPLPNVHWVYLDLPRWTRFWKRGSRGLRSYYVLWQLAAYFAVRRLHHRISFDLMHHITFGNYWMPSFLPLLPVAFIWGPVGGAESAPRAFWYSFSLRGKLYELLRDLARKFGDLNPLVRLSARRASVVLSKSEETKKRLEALGCRRAVVCSEVVLPADEICRLNAVPIRNGNTFGLISIGRLIHWKGFELGLKAFADFHRQFPASHYWIIGNGPERRRLEGLARQLDVVESVQFFGNLPRAQVLEKLLASDVLVHPSLHDSGGWVCVEAMAAGRPVICLDLGGPAFQVSEQSGIKVSADSPKQAVRELAVAMEQLAQDPVRRHCLGKGARKRVQKYFSWDSKREWVNSVYSSSSHAGK